MYTTGNHFAIFFFLLFLGWREGGSGLGRIWKGEQDGSKMGGGEIKQKCMIPSLFYKEHFQMFA